MPKGHGKPTRTGTRHAPDVRQGMVLEAAARLIADEGLMAATMRRIAQEAGISLGTLTHHFSSADELLDQALELASIRFSESLLRSTAKGTGLTRLRALVRAIMPDNENALRQWRLWIQFWSRAAYEPTLARTHDRRYRAWYTLVSGILEDGITDGSLRPELKVSDAVSSLVAIIDGVCFQVALNADAMTAAQGRRIITRTIHAFASR